LERSLKGSALKEAKALERLEQMYEGKAKIVYATADPDLVVVEFKDSATAFDGQKKGTITGKGVVNARTSVVLFNLLEEEGIPTHLVKVLDEKTLLVKRLEIIPVEMVARNIVAGSLSKRLGMPEGAPLLHPVLEHYLKSDELGDPMINRYHIKAMGLASSEEMDQVESLSQRINTILSDYLRERDLILVDFKLEFGRHHGQVLLGDEISPDTCRFWDAGTRERLDKDRFRRDLGGVEEAYQEALARIEGRPRS
jgi:phosphoribosylaminoimidazole-succinocarboxamide synthase